MGKRRKNPAGALDYKVGYKRPPTEHQIKKGERLNPNGRPRIAKAAGGSVASIVRDILHTRLSVVEGGKQTKKEILPLLLEQFFRKAIGGTARELRFALELAMMAEALPLPEAERVDYRAEVRAKLEALAGRVAERRRLEAERLSESAAN